jgi:hypothetical protein
LWHGQATTLKTMPAARLGSGRAAFLSPPSFLVVVHRPGADPKYLKLVTFFRARVVLSPVSFTAAATAALKDVLSRCGVVSTEVGLMLGALSPFDSWTRRP